MANISIHDLVERHLCLSSVIYYVLNIIYVLMMFFSKALAIYLEGSILNLVEYYLRLTDVFLFQ